jgi:hypothetical protein
MKICFLYKLKLVFMLWLFGIVLISCKQNSEPVYSFFVAGHVYGQPGVDHRGVYPLFQLKLDSIQSDSTVKFGVFTGDIVIGGTIENWEEIDSVVSRFGRPIYFAPGNHDVTDVSLYKERYGDSYYYFSFQEDLFIILNPNLDKWNISGAQLDFLKQTLHQKAAESNHVFVFFHQLLWVSPNNQYKNVKVNSLQGRADTINFWTELVPLFQQIEKPVYMFAGDIGATADSDNNFYAEYDNIHLSASGMGNGKGDNFLLVDVFADKKVRINIKPL